jgi:hypothetical protein
MAPGSPQQFLVRLMPGPKRNFYANEMSADAATVLPLMRSLAKQASEDPAVLPNAIDSI